MASFSQPRDLRFVPLNADDGLSQNTINSIYQDRSGFIWFGTQDGLNRYDGHTFKTYRHEPGNANSLSNNYIWAIHEDHQRILWIGSFGGGLTRFDPATEVFTNFTHDAKNPQSLSNNNVFAIAEYPEGTLWLCTDDGLNKFDTRTGATSRYLNKTDNSTAARHTSAVAIQPPEHVWASLSNILFRLNIATGTADTFRTAPATSTVMGFITQLTFRNDKLRIMCEAGMIEYNVPTNTSSFVDRKEIADGTLSLRRVLHDPNGYVWFGTNNGLVLCDSSYNTLVHATHESDNKHSLTNSFVLSLFQSREGIVWVGTRDGLNRLDAVKGNFQTLRRKTNSSNTLSHRTVRRAIEDARGILWIGTVDGLDAYDRSRNSFTSFKHEPSNTNTISSSYILHLYEDSKQNIWVSTRGGGLNRLSFPNGDLTRVVVRRFPGGGAQGLLSASVYCVLEDRSGTMWVGTQGHGLAKYVAEQEKFIHFSSASDGTGPSHSYVYCMLEDRFGNFWIGTPTGGLNLFDRESGRFIYFRNHPDNPHSLSNNIVLSLHEAANGSLWVGTSGGLNKLTIPLRPHLFRHFQDSAGFETDSLFVVYGRHHGLPNEVIYGILEDGKGQLWLSTNRGLAVFDPRLTNPVIKLYDASDGLAGNEFNQASYFKNARGEMFFGGTDGLTYFHPDSIRGNTYVPPVVFTEFRLFNKPVSVSAKSPLRQAIHRTDVLELSYDDYVASFDFAALSFVNPEKNKYSYKLEGFDKEWSPASTQHSATYTNLSPGDYVLRVKASNSDGVWNEEGASLRLSIAPPLWLRWYAYIAYVGMFVAGVMMFVRYRVRSARREMETETKIERAKLQEREDVRRQSSADFHDEAGHKLTKITLFTELARGEAVNNSSLKEYLGRIEEQTKELSAGMRDFIWVLDPVKDSLFETVSRLKDFGNAMFGYTETSFAVHGLRDIMSAIPLSMESRRALMLIFKEAMNNCMKYARAKNVVLEVRLDNDMLELSLRDDGAGFDCSKASGGYGMTTMRDRARKLGAEFTVTSSPGEGTTISLHAPLHLFTKEKGSKHES
ncbi:MAG: hypothetical protein KF749_04525 [Bacteroidetes bacterium]|nr:hypothetical protein [Bacteroidota bacterium]MCW5895467.1 hypothetical protein [Bacteroidota bacterium]